MMATIVVASLLLGLLAGSIVLWALLLSVGLRWAKVEKVTARRVVFATISVVFLQTTIAFVSYLLSPAGSTQTLILGMAEIVANVLVPCFLIMRVFRVAFLRALQAWLPTLLMPIVMLAVVFLVVRPFLVESFVSPTNAMAPTLLGNHWQGKCVECGNPAFCSPIPPQYATRDAPSMICRDFHVTQPTDRDEQVLSADRFLVAKFLGPRRWDLVVFCYPEDPSILYVMRLVGLPGEEITIQDGRVWANGVMLTPPDSIRGITYLSEMTGGYWALWGSPDRPAKLADDEYFVLGDFSPQSKDSRLWEGGAPRHSPFAVPKSHLYGVVTSTYWPPNRCRAFR